MLDLGHPKFFVALAEELHFGRAANRPHISQPPLSLKIRALEADLGLQLFNRSSRRVELTHSGSVLLNEARRLLVESEQLVTLAAALELGTAGTLSIGLNAVMAYRIMPSLIAAFTAQETIAIEDLATEPMVMFSATEAVYQHHLVMDICADAGFAPIVRQETRHIHAIVALVSVGMGVALLPASATSIHINDVQVSPLKPLASAAGHRKARFRLAMYGGNANPAARRFMEVARGAAL